MDTVASGSLNARHVLERDKQILDRRRRSLAGALQAEIQYLGNLCNLRAIQIADLIPEGEERFVMDERQRDEWKIGGMTIYNSNAADMGLLPAETTEKVVWIYTRLANLNLVVSGGVITNKAKKGMEELAIGATAVITDLQEVVDSKFDT